MDLPGHADEVRKKVANKSLPSPSVRHIRTLYPLCRCSLWTGAQMVIEWLVEEGTECSRCRERGRRKEGGGEREREREREREHWFTKCWCEFG